MRFPSGFVPLASLLCCVPCQWPPAFDAARAALIRPVAQKRGSRMSPGGASYRPISRLTFSSAFLRSDWSLSNSSCNGPVNIADSALRSIDGTVATMFVGVADTDSSGACQLTMAITATAAATPVIVLAHQNNGGFEATGRCVSVAGVTARRDASIRRSSSSETVTLMRSASARSCFASLSIGFTLVCGAVHLRFERAPSSHQVNFGP